MTGVPRKRIEYETDSKLLYDMREQLANINKVLREVLAVLKRHEVFAEDQPESGEESW